MSAITPFLWFDDTAEQAVEFYLSVFPDSGIRQLARYGEAGPGVAGTVMTIAFHLRDQDFVALNGGPVYQFTPAVSFVIDCSTQAEVDHYWDRLVEDGGEHSQCGWLTDRFGVTWQVVPRQLHELLSRGGDGARRVNEAMLAMDRLVIADLEAAYAES